MLAKGSYKPETRNYGRVGEALRKSMKSCALATDAETSLDAMVRVDLVE